GGEVLIIAKVNPKTVIAPIKNIANKKIRNVVKIFFVFFTCFYY
ncbi:hypothetical protein SFB5_227G2, partial [Candidatus Arthromitus sp. SFB-5]